MRVEIDIEDEASDKLDRIAESEQHRQRLLRGVARGMRRAALLTIGEAQKERFRGKGPFPPSQRKLGVVTGLLRRSLRASAPTVQERTGEVSIEMGSNVKYFHVHEFGFDGRVQVRGHTRRNLPSGKIRRGKLTKKSAAARASVLRERELSGNRRRGVVGASQVRPHHRKMKIPARRPLAAAIEDVGRVSLRTEVLREIDAAYRAATR